MVLNSPPAKQSACTSVISVNTLHNRLSCWTKILSTEAKFLDVIFDRTLSYSSRVNYLKTNCVKDLNVLKVIGHTDWGADQKTLLCFYGALIRSKLDHGCIWGSFKQHSKQTGPYPSPRPTNCSWNFSYFSCNKPLCESTRDVFEKQTQETVYELCFGS